MAEKPLRLGDILVDYGCITESQLVSALKLQKENNNKRLGEILLDQGMITDAQLLDALSKRLSIPVVDLQRVSIDMDAVDLIPKALAIKYSIIAVSKKDGRITLVVNDPLDFYAIEDVKSLLPMPAVLALAPKRMIHDIVNRYYSELDAKKAMTSANIEGIGNRTAEVQAVDDDAPVINLVNSILLKAYSEGASDVHFEPFEEHIKVRYRIDGLLIDYLQLERAIGPNIATRIKIMSGLDIAERRIPQDGHCRATIGGIGMNLRVSIVPTVFGEKLVMRFLSQNTKLDFEGHFGMSEKNFKALSTMLNSPHGIIYMTGPTGSGKTTTLYMAIERMAQASINVCTIEDPVERTIHRVNQVQVNPAVGLTFESGLRAFLRQDPDVILVGETRDSETAKTAISAAITGHLVLSTLHTNDAISTIVRLEDMGIESYLIASSLIGVVAQRLVKKICPFCKTSYQPNAEEIETLGEDTTLYRGTGCVACNQTGYKGRLAVHEVLKIDSEMRQMIAARRPIAEIYEYVKEKEAITFISDSVRSLVLEGVTTLKEYEKFISTTV